MPQRTRAVAAVLSLMVLSCVALVQTTETGPAMAQVATAQASPVIGADATPSEASPAPAARGAISRELDMPFFSFAGLTRATRL